MRFDYLAAQINVFEAIQDTGKPILLRRVEVIESPGGTGNTEIITEQMVFALETDFDHELMSNGAIGLYDVQFRIPGYKLNPDFGGFNPLREYNIIDETNNDWGFIHVKRQAPGGIVLYFDIQAYT